MKILLTFHVNIVVYLSYPPIETAMGVSVHAQTNADSEYVRAVKT